MLLSDDTKFFMPSRIYLLELPDGEKIQILDLESTDMELFEVEGVGACILKALKSDASFADILQIVEQDYEVSEDDLRKDIVEFLTDMHERKLIEMR